MDASTTSLRRVRTPARDTARGTPPPHLPVSVSEAGSKDIVSAAGSPTPISNVRFEDRVMEAPPIDYEKDGDGIGAGRPSLGSSILDDSKSIDLGAGDVYDTYDLPRSSQSLHTRPSAWTEYLPIGEEVGRDASDDLPAPDVENPAVASGGSSSLRDHMQKLRDVTHSTLERARDRRAHRRSRLANDMWIPMQDTSSRSTQSEAQKRHPRLSQRLRGMSLCYFGPHHPLRVRLANVLSLPWVEPTILCMILVHLVILVVFTSRNVQSLPYERPALRTPEGWILLGVFILYTLEMLARIIVSGLVINPPPLSTSDDKTDTGMAPRHELSNTRDVLQQWYDDVYDAVDRFLHPYSGRVRQHALDKLSSLQPTQGVAMVGSRPPEDDERVPDRALESTHWLYLVYREIVVVLLHLSNSITGDTLQMSERAYLRHSWHRVDAISVISFWISVGLQAAGAEHTSNYDVYLFRSLSMLRCTRLLGMWEGTETILRSIKRVGPLLLRVFCFLVFAMTLFAVIGIQSFKGSYLRQCVWIGDLNNEPGTNYTLQQNCGGSVDPRNASLTISHIPYEGTLGPPHSAKGYICPYGQLCIEQDSNPFNNVQSFDDVFHSFMQVAIITSLNGWSNAMYNMIDAESYVSVIFFIFGIILLNFWLANLFVAVISHSFASLSAQTERSAFAAERNNERPVAASGPQRPQRRRRIVAWYHSVHRYTRYIWLALIVVSVAVQGSQASYEFPEQRLWRQRLERYLVIPFDLEMVIRWTISALEYGPWHFFSSRRNVLDFCLAVITTIMQIPPVPHSAWYPWLTFFQLLRFYRVIAAIPRMKSLLFRIVGSMAALFNMIAFLVMSIFLAGIFSTLLLRGEIAATDDEGNGAEFTWKQLFNGFLGVYQIFSSENWTSTMYNVISSAKVKHQGVIVAIFMVAWFICANFILLQMFIAVINENFRVAERDKYAQQLKNHLKRNEAPKDSWLTRIMQHFSPFRIPAEHPTAPHALEGPSLSNIQTYTSPSHAYMREDRPFRSAFMQLVNLDNAGRAFDTLQRMLRLDKPREYAYLASLQAQVDANDQQHSGLGGMEDVVNDPRDPRYLGDTHVRTLRTDLGLANDNDADAFMQQYTTPEDNPRIRLARLVNANPYYDRSWFLFSNRNPVRRFCQSLTQVAHGERVFGRPVSRVRNLFFKIIVFGAIVGSVVIAAIATPAYRKEYYSVHKSIYYSWFAIIEISMSTIFVVEFFVKTIADGFAFTPNAYMLNPWNLLDLFVLVFQLVNVISELVVPGGVSHFTRAIKAFRALRLISLSSLLRDTFHAVIIAGAGYILDASILALLYIIPYAIWGQNLFAGLLYACNDNSNSIHTKFDCHGEYGSTPLNWAFLAPRVWQNPTEGSKYSFDDFKSALLILFEIVSLEGWINVMTQAMSITGPDMQPKADAAQYNAIFFLVYNLIGAVSVLTLFVSVIIENFQRYSGAAYLTTAQRQWLDLKRQLQRQVASKRPAKPPSNKLIRWCFEASIQKRGWWQRTMALLYCVVLVLLMSQTNDESLAKDRALSIAFAVLACVFLFDLVVRLIGLGFTSFRRSYWNCYDAVIMTGALVTSILRIVNPSQSDAHAQLQKIFLTGVTLKLVQRSDALDLLFKTAVGSLPAIVALFVLWLIMFLVWGVMLVEVFGLTKWGANETYAKSMRTLWQTLVFLFMTSTGEGWNSYMHDFALQPPMCTPSNNYLYTDCGSVPWAYFLFISWNILSMYIFLNMFTGTVVENFSYVYHLQGSSALSRDQMRQYKDAWSHFDPQGSGYISKEQVVPFLAKLSGMFEVGMYPPELRVPALINECRAGAHGSTELPGTPMSQRRRRRARSRRFPGSPSSDGRSSPSPSPASEERSMHTVDFSPQPNSDGSSMMPLPRVVAGLDLNALDKALDQMSLSDVRQRRLRFNRIYQEALMSDLGKGISFSAMLFIVAYHKLRGPASNMEVSEFIQRRELMDRIDAKINLERVRGLLRSVHLRRRFLAMRAGAPYRSVAVPAEPGFPSITVEQAEPTTLSPAAPVSMRTGLRIQTQGLGALSNASSDEPSSATSDEGTSDFGGSAVSPSHLSPMSAQPRRRNSFRMGDDDPFSDPPQPHTPTDAYTDADSRPSPGLDTWFQVLRRLSDDAMATGPPRTPSPS